MCCCALATIKTAVTVANIGLLDIVSNSQARKAVLFHLTSSSKIHLFINEPAKND
jgi:hypothetical protein